MNLRWQLKSWDELSKEELYKIFSLRIAVFVIEQNCPYQDVDGKDLNSYHLFALNENDSCVACLRIVKPGVSYPEWSIGRVANALSYRNKGLGKELMQRAMNTLQSQFGNPPVRISAQCYLQKFYEDFGFRQQGESYMEDNIPHIEMLYAKQGTKIQP